MFEYFGANQWEHLLLLDTLLPDFLLAAAIFISLSYAVLSRRLEQQRPAVVMSVALGVSLAVGLVTWQYQTGWSVRDLGPVAVGILLFVLATVIHQSLSRIGGNWTGASIAFFAVLLVGSLLGMPWSLGQGFIQTTMLLLMCFGVGAYLVHHHRIHPQFPAVGGGAVRAPARHDLSDLYMDRKVAVQIAEKLNQVKSIAKGLNTPDAHPGLADRVRDEVAKLLPAEGWLTDRLSRLRQQTQFAIRGEVSKIDALQRQIKSMPATQRARVAKAMALHVKKMRLDHRLERLDQSVAKLERQLRHLTQQINRCLERNQYERVPALLDTAFQFQKHVVSLIDAIERTEQKIDRVAQHSLKADVNTGVQKD